MDPLSLQLAIGEIGDDLGKGTLRTLLTKVGREAATDAGERETERLRVLLLDDDPTTVRQLERLTISIDADGDVIVFDGDAPGPADPGS